MEHGLAKKGSAQGQAVEPAHKCFPLPGLDGVGKACLVKLHVGFLHGRPKPGFFSHAAGLYHSGKCLIAGYAKVGLSYGAQGPFGTVVVFGENDTAGIWTPPEYGLALIEPGKDAFAVGRKKEGQ